MSPNPERILVFFECLCFEKMNGIPNTENKGNRQNPDRILVVFRELLAIFFELPLKNHASKINKIETKKLLLRY